MTLFLPSPDEKESHRVNTLLRQAIQYINLILPSRGQHLGTAASDVAAAGNVGEVLTATVVAASAISISNGVPFTLASLTLSPGNWEVSSFLHFVTAATTNVTQMQSGVNVVDATLNPTGVFAHNAMTFAPFVPGPGRILSSRTTGNVQTLAAPLTIYCVGQLDFTVSTATAWGGIRAWRRR